MTNEDDLTERIGSGTRPAQHDPSEIARPSESRSRTMRAVKSKDTAAEMAVRRLLHSMGYRFRLHYSQLPGCPDIVFPTRRKVVFVNGCFWHGHDCARGSRMPKTNSEYWAKKIQGNVSRDNRTLAEFARMGWRVLVVWECELKADDLPLRLRDFLD